MLGKIRSRLAATGGSGYYDPSTGALWGAPWSSKREGGIYMSNQQCWVYRNLDVATVYWEEAEKKLQVGAALEGLLREVAESVRDSALSVMQMRRPIHLVSIQYNEPLEFHPDTPPQLEQYLQETIGGLPMAKKAVFLGVQLFSEAAAVSAVQGIMRSVRKKAEESAGMEVHDFEQYAADFAKVDELLLRGGATRPPTDEQAAMLESWYAAGGHRETTIHEFKTHVKVDSSEIEMSAIMDFGERSLWHAPSAEWIDDIQTHSSSAEVVSVRAWIEPQRVSRENMKKAQRLIQGRINEEMLTGNYDAPEDTEALKAAQQAEELVTAQREPLLADCSIIMARKRTARGVEKYHDVLRKNYDITAKPLEHRQMAALDETLPCSLSRVNPFLQYTNIGMFAYSGVQGFSQLGDPKGAYLGLVDPHGTPCFLDPRAASANDLPPIMLLAGDPGSGKTFTLQVVAAQTAWANIRTVLINPKPGDSLAALLHLVDGELIKLSEAETDPGYFDPFRFCPRTPSGRRQAAAMLYNHIDGVLRNLTGVADGGLTENQLVAIRHDLDKSAADGANYGMAAIESISDIAARDLVIQQLRDPLFALGVSPSLKPNHRQSKNLRLIEFDRPLSIPEKGANPSTFTRAQRLAMGAVSLITSATLEMMEEGAPGQQGGLVVVDEAWMYLQSGAGQQAVQSMGRLGRSKNIMMILATQRVNDMVRQGMDLENLLSRVLVLKLQEEQEIRAALELCRLKPTAQRIAYIRDSGPKRDESGQTVRPARGLHRDIQDRHAAVYIAPVNEHVRLAISTNPDDRKRQAEVFGTASETDEESSYLEELFN